MEELKAIRLLEKWRDLNWQLCLKAHSISEFGGLANRYKEYADLINIAIKLTKGEVSQTAMDHLENGVSGFSQYKYNEWPDNKDENPQGDKEC